MSSRVLRSAVAAAFAATLLALSAGSATAQPPPGVYLRGPDGAMVVEQGPGCVPLERPFVTQAALNRTEVTVVLFRADRQQSNPCSGELALMPPLRPDEFREYEPPERVGAVAFLIGRG
ncbi:hypothetical protein [Streptomyces sp. YIM 98790]|uniref:hypothetical protein n=1 Tax=Streptomyces sp. YIM 98790 TaxID=2689077 RepID=UPI0014099DAF|nr:hypothetical protein [Streptomyces sp. YIM 98790]